MSDNNWPHPQMTVTTQNPDKLTPEQIGEGIELRSRHFRKYLIYLIVVVLSLCWLTDQTKVAPPDAGCKCKCDCCK